MPRSIRMLAAAGAVSALIAIAPAAASAETTASPTNLDFGTVPVGTQSIAQVVTLTESCAPLDLTCLNGTLQQAFSPVISATPGFVQTNSCPTSLITTLLGLPQSCTISVSLVPNLVGQITGLLSTGPGGPTVTLNGAGSAPPSGSGTGTKTRRRKCKKRKHKHHSLAASAKKHKKCKKKRK